MLIIIGLVVTALVCGILYLYQKVMGKRHPKEPPFGVLKNGARLEMIDFGKDAKKYIEDAHKQHGDAFTVRTPTLRFTFIKPNNTEERKKFYSDSGKNFSFDEFIEKVAGHVFSPDSAGIVHRDDNWHGPKAAVDLEMVRKGFLRKDRLDLMTKVVNDQVGIAFANWMDKLKSNDIQMNGIDLFKEVTDYVIDTDIIAMIGDSIFNQHRDELIRCYHDIETYGFTPPMVIFPRWLPTHPRRIVEKSRSRLYELITQVCTRYMNHILSVEQGKSVEPISDYDRNSYLYMVIDSCRDKFSFEIYSLHVTLILFAAQTNTSSTGGWVIRNILKNTEVYEKVVGALNNGSEEEVEEYMERCMRETGRLQGMLTLTREAMEDIEIMGGQYVIPKGNIVMVTPKLMHQDEELYPRAEEFLPERWEDPEKVREWMNSAQFVQFGLGKHRCLGEKFAWVQLKTLWIELFRRYEVKLIKDSEPNYFRNTGSPYPLTPILFSIHEKSSAPETH